MKKKKKGGRRLVHWIMGLLMAGIICFGAALTALCIAEANPPKLSQPSQALIVLGCQVKPDGKLSLQLLARLETALKAYEENPQWIIVTGGQGKDEPLPEAEAMAAWLREKGVPDERLIVENQSRSTRENLENAKALLPEGVQFVTVITSDYHLPRALAMAGDAGLNATGIGAPTTLWVKNHTREVLAWGKYLAGKIIPALQ